MTKNVRSENVVGRQSWSMSVRKVAMSEQNGMGIACIFMYVNAAFNALMLFNSRLRYSVAHSKAGC